MSVIVLTYLLDYKNAMGNNAFAISELQAQHKEERLNERMVKQEQITEDINKNLSDIKTFQGKIFDRINTIADRGTNR